MESGRLRDTDHGYVGSQDLSIEPMDQSKPNEDDGGEVDAEGHKGDLSQMGENSSGGSFHDAYGSGLDSWFVSQGCNKFVPTPISIYSQDILETFAFNQKSFHSDNDLIFKTHSSESTMINVPMKAEKVRMPLWNVNQLAFSRLINTWDTDSGKVKSLFSDMHFKVEPSLSFKGNYCNCVNRPGKAQHQFNPK